jgi:uncharacterized protein YgiM (DUF1202 family)
MKRKLVLPAVLLAALAGAARAEDVWLKTQAEIRNDQSAAADSILSVNKGDKATVVERSGAWVKITLKGQTGWVSANSLSAREVKGESALLGGNSSAESSSGAAGRGLEKMAADFANAKGLSKAGLDEMVANRKLINAPMLKSFVAEGNIHPPARNNPAASGGAAAKP